MNKIVPLILAGGIGMRLWPISRVSFPKQLMTLPSGIRMLKNTLDRLKNIENLDDPIVVCSNECKAIIAEELKQTFMQNYSIIVEPVSRDTAPALAAAVIKLFKHENKNKICLVLPADHHIDDIPLFIDSILYGCEYASEGYFVTFGITPNHPSTGYGYINYNEEIFLNNTHKVKSNKSVFSVKKFVEKPDFEAAKIYLNSRNYLWNSGIFMFRSDLILQELKHLTPDIVKACKLAINEGIKKDTFFYLEEKAFMKSPKISIDCAIMEKAINMSVIPMDVGWKDLGTWDSFMQISNKDKYGNVKKGDVMTYDVHRSYIHADSRLVTAIGIDEYIIVETNDAVLVAPLDRTQEIKHIVQKLFQTNRKEAFYHKKRYFNWGNYEELFNSDILTINFVILEPNNFFCLEDFFESGGNWIVISGKAIVLKDKLKFVLHKKQSIKTENDSKYFFYNLSNELGSLKLVEIRGNFFLN